MSEIWKDIDGFEGLYQISSKGNIRSQLTGKWIQRKLTNKKGDYLRVVLVSKNKRKSISIHRLVANAFIPNPNNLPCINHIDMNKQNNSVENLEWCTYKHNIKEAIKYKPQIIGGIVKYNTEVRPKTIYQFTLDGKFVAEYKNAKIAGETSGVCPRNILQVANKTPFNNKGDIRKQAGGFIWRLNKEEVVI